MTSTAQAIHARWIVPVDAADTVLERHTLVVENDRITDAARALSEYYKVDTVLMGEQLHSLDGFDAGNNPVPGVLAAGAGGGAEGSAGDCGERSAAAAFAAGCGGD